MRICQSGLSPDRLICVRVRAEEFNEETLHRNRRAGVSLAMLCDAWDGGASLVGKTMHCTAVNNELPVRTRAVHFFNKRAHAYITVRSLNRGSRDTIGEMRTHPVMHSG